VQVRLRVGGVTLDPRDGRAVILMVEERGSRVFPLWVGDDEAAAVARALSGRGQSSSTDTHGLLAAAVRTLGAGVAHVEITGVVSSVVTAAVVTASVHLADADGNTALPARPSDAIALALRMGAPVLVDEELLAQVAARVADAEARTSRNAVAAEPVQMSQAERWNQLLAHLSSSRSPKNFEG
jgi:bifunctional DNase/RNase